MAARWRVGGRAFTNLIQLTVDQPRQIPIRRGLLWLDSESMTVLSRHQVVCFSTPGCRHDMSDSATAIEKEIDERIGQVRTDPLDLSFGEIINLHSSKEFIIAPDFQRYFRWTQEQKSRLIESVLIQLPIPPIFVIETETGVMELIDGLQRISSVIQFINHELLTGLDPKEPLRLAGCDLIPSLNGKLFEDLPLSLRLRLKRCSVRTIIIKRQSSPSLRYSMFKRLNTGGSLLSAQEIRNCTSRMAGAPGLKFYEFLKQLAGHEAFKKCTSSLSSVERQARADEELVLRFFAMKNAKDMFKKSVRDWLDGYMDEVVLEKVGFEYPKEEASFKRLFELLAKVLGEGSFVRYRDDKPIGALAPAYFEAVSMGVWNNIDAIESTDQDIIKKKIIGALQKPEFRDYIGPGANRPVLLSSRIEFVERALKDG